ncbi:uncharacterized protein LOC133725042 isoform X2 [Rosa rugosa]|uniref:uncharacterized protein LOC133725042 isoform X2 n=1 Tax=Rosa rugosa TaxID=74645 RepID=UPI002B40CB57|nr:uncharacterized protein LOC133725042 isoform X2 [Rosa rugosa]
MIGGSPSSATAFAARPLRGITHCCYYLGIGCCIPFVGYSCCKVLRSFLFLSQSLRDRRLLLFVFNLGLWKGHLRLPIPLPCILQLMVPALEPLQHPHPHPHPHPLLLRWWIKVINKELQHCLVGLYFLFGSSSCRHFGMNRLILNWTC